MKQQYLLTGAGLLLLASLLFFGKTVAKKDPAPAVTEVAGVPTFKIDSFLLEAKQKLPLDQAEYVNKLENSVSRGDVNHQQVKAYEQLAAFWKDSAKQGILYSFYTAQAAKLVNSEKNLTFAAQQILSDLRHEQDPSKRSWKAGQAIELFEKALAINPGSDSLKIGLGSCYVFGKGMVGDAQETMKGIQQLLQVVRKDSMNMQAQLVLGIGGVLSTQYDKAIERLLLVLKNQPANLEAISWLADAYAAKGDKANAIDWYNRSKRLVNDPAYSREVDERIKELNK